MIQYIPIVLIALGVGLLATQKRGKKSDTKSDKHVGGGAGKHRDRQQHSDGEELHRKGGLNEPSGMEPEELGRGPSNRARDNSGGQPDAAEVHNSDEAITDGITETKSGGATQHKKGTRRTASKKSAKKVASNDEKGSPSGLSGDDPSADGGEHSQSGGDTD